jgi:hypothetical protein
VRLSGYEEVAVQARLSDFERVLFENVSGTGMLKISRTPETARGDTE